MHLYISIHFWETNLLQILINYLYPYIELFHFDDQEHFYNNYIFINTKQFCLLEYIWSNTTEIN